MVADAQPARLTPAIDRSADGASTSGAPEDSGGPVEEPAALWDSLPEECKQLVLERLSPLDAARAARVSGRIYVSSSLAVCIIDRFIPLRTLLDWPVWLQATVQHLS